MKLMALNFKYFTIPWNVFDFIIVIASILGTRDSRWFCEKDLSVGASQDKPLAS